MTSMGADQVRMPSGVLWALRLGGAVLGGGLAFGVPPLADWLAGLLSGVPLPLELAAKVPFVWLVPILTLVGLAVGFWLAAEADKECPVLTVNADGIEVSLNNMTRYLVRDRIAEIFTDPKELVVLGKDGRELLRTKASDLSADRLETVLKRHGYPWRGTADPYETRFHRWVDGHPDLDEPVHNLLRRRRKALTGDRTDDAEQFTQRLHEHGVLVRDRKAGQEYRTVSVS